MKYSLISQLNEDQKPDGTFAGVRFSEDTNKKIQQFIKKNKIPNGTPVKELHITLLFSRKVLPDYKPATYEEPIEAEPIEFDIWESRAEENEKPKNVLVLKVKCPELVKRHNDLMEQHNATYDFPDYIPHVTFSYDAGDFSVDELPLFEENVEITHEYKEDLNLD